MKDLKVIFKIFMVILKTVLTLCIIAVFSIILVQRVSNNKFTVGGYSIYTIISPSMRPEYEVFDINYIPRMAFDHGDIIANAISCLKRELLNLDNLKIIFPADFTLPELQKVYEEVLGEKIDRRNFRKKFLPCARNGSENSENYVWQFFNTYCIMERF